MGNSTLRLKGDGMSVVRLAGASALIVVVAVMFATPSASASSSRADAKVKVRITNTTIYFNKKETLKLSVGAGAITTLAAALPPPIDVIIAGVAALVAAQAGYAAVDGNCVAVRVSHIPMFVPVVVPYIYKPSKKGNGRYCR